MIINPKNLKIPLIVSLVLLALVAIVLIFRSSSLKTPTLKSTLPLDDAKNVTLISSVSFVFNEAVLLADFTLSSDPSFNYLLTQPNPETIIASHPLSFQPSTTYTLTLNWKGRLLTTKQFSTLVAQEDPLLIQNMKDELASDYPLGNSTPYETPSYRVVYSAPLTLAISLKSPGFDQDLAISEIKSWVKSQGGNVDLHKYVIAAPN